MQSVRALTDGLIDYAGLFPPAGLEMAPALRNYAEYLTWPQAPMLGRFILPASRLSEFSSVSIESLQKGSGAPTWKLAVLLGGDLDAEIRAISKLRGIDTVEIKAADVATVLRLKSALPDYFRAFVEIPATEPEDKLFDAVRDAGFSAKIRTGGTEAGAFPSAKDIIQFMNACRSRGIAFKATAGLHHIVCGRYPVTYEPNAKKAEMFGFLNIFAAAVFLFHGTGEWNAAAILQENEAGAFVFREDGLSWRDKTASLEQIMNARREFAISFGSCSFTEPVEEMEKLLALTSTRGA